MCIAALFHYQIIIYFKEKPVVKSFRLSTNLQFKNVFHKDNIVSHNLSLTYPMRFNIPD
jgi:hypothetical protein